MHLRSEYVELHLHTAFSFLDGASLPEEMVARAVELEYRALAITDHDGLYGAMEFTQAALAAGIAPIIGAELTLTDGSHLTLLAESERGYANLSRLITEAHRDPADMVRPPQPRNSGGSREPRCARLSPLSRAPGEGGWGGEGRTPSNSEGLGEPHAIPYSLRGIGKSKPRYRATDLAPALDPTLIRDHAEGLILLTGCRQGKLAQLIDAGQFQAARAQVDEYVEWLGEENVFIEVQQTFTYGDTRRIKRLVELAEDRGLQYVATGNVHYHLQNRHRLQDVLVAIRHRATLDSSHRERRPNAQFYLRSAAEMAGIFARYPSAIAATAVIAERCTGFNIAHDLSYHFPDYPTESGETPDALLEQICREALVARYGPHHPIAEPRLNEELRLITHHGLAGFFLLYRDLLIMAREVAAEVRGTDSARSRGNLPPGRGRGSSVGSIVCYLIGLSHVDPLAHDLFVGRFLNEEMHSVPDIDLDFPREIRERLIERVYERYGADHAALVCAFSTYKLRSAVRDIGKALGLPLHDLDRIAKLSEPRSAKDLGMELERLPTYAARKDAPPWTFLVELAEQLAGFPRHVTQHVGGMIVSSVPLTDLVPIQPAAMAGRYLCQWDKDSCEDARVVKIDFLALGMLSLVEECLELMAASGKEPVDLSRIDFNDSAVYDMICAGDTIGVFQIESRAQIQMLPRTYPRKLDHLVIQVAIVRPGPIVGGAVAPYVLHRQEERLGFPITNPTYDHPLLEPVLKETLGVILFQEQVLQVAMVLANFTAGQADALRRAMSRKRSREAMDRLREQFMDGAMANNVTQAIAESVFEKLMGFAEYGFPKSHAAAFAVLAYQSAWLKRYHPAEFTCALLNNQPMGFYPPHVLTNDAKRHGIRVLPPDINQSGVRCSVELGNMLRIGFGYVKGLGEEPAQRMVLEREAHGPYLSLADFIRRVPLPTEAVENLVAVGAFDRFGLGRREGLWQIGLFIAARRFGQKPGTDNGRQLPLALPVEQDMVELRPMGIWDQTGADYRILGLSPRYHPLGVLRPRLPDTLATTSDLEQLDDGTLVRIAGLVVCRQRPGTAKGITFLLMEDERGLANVIVYPNLYETHRLIVRGEPFIIVEGRLQKQDGTINIIAHTIAPLDGARQEFAAPPTKRAEDPLDNHTQPAETPVTTLSPRAHNYR